MLVRTEKTIELRLLVYPDKAVNSINVGFKGLANDNKYPMLKLDTASKCLQDHLYLADSIYQINPGIREMVIQREEQNKRNLEMLQKAGEMENEAKEMKSKVFKDK